MRAINIHQAKTQLSKLLEKALHGEEIIIAKAGVPIARLVPFVPTKNKIRLGVLKGKIKISDDFDAPLPDDILNDFENE